jgi:hypothetical protein
MFVSNTSTMNVEPKKTLDEQELSIEWLKIRNSELEKSNNLLIDEIAELRRLEIIKKNQIDLIAGEKTMYKNLIRFVQLVMVVGIFGFAATAVSAQTNTGTVTITGNVSKFVELSSGGEVTLSGNSAGTGGVTTNGVVNNPLAVSVNLGELGPTNTASFVTATVPLKMRSNTNYVLSMSAVVNSSGTTTEKIGASDIGFGLGTITRAGTGVHTSGADNKAAPADPTTNGAVNATTGRFEFTAANSSLRDFSTAKPVMNGDRIMNAVHQSNTNGLVVPAIFAIKPQFFEPGNTTATVTFTITAP